MKISPIPEVGERRIKGSVKDKKGKEIARILNELNKALP
jgi:hypothetical protein